MHSLVTTVLVAFALVGSSHACTPPPPGQTIRQYSDEEIIRMTVGASDSAFAATIISITEATENTGWYNKEAKLLPIEQGIVYGKPLTTVRFHESTCGSPLRRIYPLKDGERVVIVVRGEQMVDVFREPSQNLELFRKVADELKAKK